MTLIIGVKCANGIVIGADSAVTNVESTSLPTSSQPMKKLYIISEKIIVGFSGRVGYAQYCKDGLEESWKKNAFSDKTITEAKFLITELFRKYLRDDAKFQRDVNMSDLARVCGNELLSQAIVALPVKRIPVLLEFTPTAACEEKDENLPVVAIGSAQRIADPFLCFLRRVFWPDRLPSISEGKAAVYWALDCSIKAAPGFVGFPIEMAVLEKKDNECKAISLPREEINDLGQYSKEAEQHLAEWSKQNPAKESLQELEDLKSSTNSK